MATLVTPYSLATRYLSSDVEKLYRLYAQHYAIMEIQPLDKDAYNHNQLDLHALLFSMHGRYGVRSTYVFNNCIQNMLSIYQQRYPLDYFLMQLPQDMADVFQKVVTTKVTQHQQEAG